MFKFNTVTKYYGPALSAEFEAFSTKREALGASPVVTKRVEALFCVCRTGGNES